MPKTWFIGGGWRLPKRSTHAALQTWKFAPTAVWIVAVAIGGNALSKEERPMFAPQVAVRFAPKPNMLEH
jgi:hypothetical protein